MALFVHHNLWCIPTMAINQNTVLQAIAVHRLSLVLHEVWHYMRAQMYLIPMATKILISLTARMYIDLQMVPSNT